MKPIYNKATEIKTKSLQNEATCPEKVYLLGKYTWRSVNQYGPVTWTQRAGCRGTQLGLGP